MHLIPSPILHTCRFSCILSIQVEEFTCAQDSNPQQIRIAEWSPCSIIYIYFNTILLKITQFTILFGIESLCKFDADNSIRLSLCKNLTPWLNLALICKHLFSIFSPHLNFSSQVFFSIIYSSVCFPFCLLQLRVSSASPPECLFRPHRRVGDWRCLRGTAAGVGCPFRGLCYTRWSSIRPRPPISPQTTRNVAVHP